MATISESVSGVLALCGKRKVDLANEFGISKQALWTKMHRGSWSAQDLARVAKFCGCELAIILPDGQKINISAE